MNSSWKNVLDNPEDVKRNLKEQIKAAKTLEELYPFIRALNPSTENANSWDHVKQQLLTAIDNLDKNKSNPHNASDIAKKDKIEVSKTDSNRNSNNNTNDTGSLDCDDMKNNTNTKTEKINGK